MANYVSGVNPKILKWAREKSGYSLDEVSKILNKNIEVLVEWESGESIPTYGQLEKIAYQLYKRPIAIFFFPEPPDEPDPRQSFRTLPEFEIENLAPDTFHAIRKAEAMQIALTELNDGFNPTEQKIFRDIKINQSSDVENVSTHVRKYLGIDLEQQVEWRDSREALDEWRRIIQEKGIYIFKRSFSQGDISGFCLSDSEFPVIYLNNSTAKTRQIFTIFHELAHILLNINGITKRDSRYINSLIGTAKDIEVFCNRFAAQILVPSKDFDTWLKKGWLIEDLVDYLANRYKVSREVILRKLLDKNIVDNQYYEAKVKQWLEEYTKQNKRENGGNYYATQATYLGDKFLDLAFSKYYQGRFSVEQLADYLNVKVKSIAGLEEFVLKRGSA